MKSEDAIKAYKAVVGYEECWQPAQMGQFWTREIRGGEELG